MGYGLNLPSQYRGYVLAATFYPKQPKAQWEVWWEHTGP